MRARSVSADSCPRKFQREPTKDRQVGVEPDALDPTNAEHRQGVVVLQASELALDGGAATVEAAPLFALARDARLTVAGVLAERDDRHHVAPGTLGVDARVVIAHVHRAR